MLPGCPCSLNALFEKMLTKEELKETILDCRRGDRGAQNRLYHAFHAWATVVCLRYTKDPDAARDCVQDGFFKVFTKIDKYTGELPFALWFKKVMINTCIDRYRTLLKNVEMEEFTQVHDEVILPEILVNADADYLLHLANRLPHSYRTTFNLFAVDGYEYHEIAEMLDVSIGTVKSNLSKARLGLKKMLFNRKKEDVYER